MPDANGIVIRPTGHGQADAGRIGPYATRPEKAQVTAAARLETCSLP
jgi:hypothetical protein